MPSITLFALALFSVVGLLVNWKLESWFHQRRLHARNIRIHVNGIRGKSTVTRIVAGILRAADYKTVAKTTGSAACFIDRHGRDQPILRSGSPTILEQVDIIRNIDKDIDALVIECMAINPGYQLVCEKHIVQSNIGVITNVREDHQDVLGNSLEEIAQHLLLTCPVKGTLITAEQNPKLLEIFRKVAESKQTKLIVADPERIDDQAMSDFTYVAFKENVAIGLEIAKAIGIDEQLAWSGMVQAAPDPGVLRMTTKELNDTHFVWADLFAVNDRESVVTAMKRVTDLVSPDTTRVALLNNRTDREHRAIQFARIAAMDLKFDYIGLMGAYEQPVENELVRSGFSPDRILRFGSHHMLQGPKLLSAIADKVQTDRILLAGLVNIHTKQAESIRNFFFGKGVNQ